MTDWNMGEGWNESFEDQQLRVNSNRQPKKDNDEPVQFKLIDHIATLSVSETGWRKELNLISWNNAEPKFDIRSWKDGYSRVGKGVTLFEDEMIVLADSIRQIKLNSKNKNFKND